MGGGKDGTPTKQSKPSSSAQETMTTPSYQDWSNSMQAYYGAAGTPPFFASTVASPVPHPSYLWGGQHHLMPPYGTPVPYPALYPPGGVYTHPAMATNPNIPPTNVESDGKITEAKDRAPNKKSKCTSGIGSKAGESGNAASSSGNDGATPSAESGSDGSSDGSDDNENQHEFAGSKKGSFHQMLADGANAHSNVGGTNIQTSVVGNPVSVPATTNLNMGMDLWNPSPAGNGAAMKMRPNPSGASPTVSPGAMIGREGMMPEQWGPDEREIKRQKRKQSNRESARRSRLRKQAECEELQGRVESLSNDNNTLRDELQRLSEECQKLTSENDSIQDELTKIFGAEEISKLEIASTTQHLQSHGGESNS